MKALLKPPPPPPLIAARSRSSLWKWGITGLLLLATTVMYMDRMTLGTASPEVKSELGLNNEQYGNLELAFGLAFAAGGLTFGFLADRWRVFLLYPCLLAAWSMVGITTGWSRGYADLLLCRTLLGFFEAGHWPCALKATFALLDEKSRTMGNSILQSGASIGAIITPQVMKLVMASHEPGSWRAGFIVIGALGLLWIAAWFIFLRPRDLDYGPSEPAKMDWSEIGRVFISGRFWAVASLVVSIPILAGAPGLLWIAAWFIFQRRHDLHRSEIGKILISRRFWAVAILVISIQPAWHINRAWLTLFLQNGRGYTQENALNFNSLYYITTDVGCIAAGAISMWLIRRRGQDPHRARMIVFTGACVLTSCSIFIPMLGQGWLLLLVLLIIGAGALPLFPCYYSFTQEISPGHLGRVSGILSMWVWVITSPMHTFLGQHVDRTQSYDLGLFIAGLTPWIGVLAMMFLWKKDPVPERP